LQVLIPLDRRRLSAPARHRARAQWYDDQSFGMVLSDAGVDTVLVVRNGGEGAATWPSKGPTCAPSSTCGSSAPMRRSGPWWHPRRRAFCATTGVFWCHASRSATRQAHIASDPCRPPAGAQALHRCPTAAAAPPRFSSPRGFMAVPRTRCNRRRAVAPHLWACPCWGC
jgi:hypothetical protein